MRNVQNERGKYCSMNDSFYKRDNMKEQKFYILWKD